MIKIFTTKERREIDEHTIKNESISSIELMEKAALQCSKWIINNHKRGTIVHIFCGNGNNAGDGLAIARHLANSEFKIFVYLLFPVSSLSKDAKINYDRLINLQNISLKDFYVKVEFPYIGRDDVIIDAIFGSGLNRPIEGWIAEVIDFINQCNAKRIAIDIPSGLRGENFAETTAIFKSDITLTFQFPFLSFLMPETAAYVGEWYVFDIGLSKTHIDELSSSFYMVQEKDIMIKSRKKFAYKNIFGHALIIAGSKGMSGAPILTAKSCMRTGCGLVTIHQPSLFAPLVHLSFPEALVSYDSEPEVISCFPDLDNYSAIAVGPGIGKSVETQRMLKALIEKCKKPMVIDADALNIIALNSDLLSILPENTIITPHYGEFDRLFGKSASSFERLQKQIENAKQNRIIIILKGRYTSIVLPDGKCYFNPTGNAGMATAGSGDVLTGIIASLLALGYAPEQAAIYGVFLHGLAGDIAAERVGQEAMIASDIIKHIGDAINKVKGNAYT